MDRSLFPDDVVVLSPPVRGVWSIVNSPGHARFAFDLAAVSPYTGSTLRTSRFAHIFGRTTIMDSFSWRMPIRSPAAGIVRSVSNQAPDRVSLSLVRDIATMLTVHPRLAPDDISPFAGNYVIVETDQCYVFIAHMRCGSVRVAVGENVMAGQVLGEVGNSGFTLEPHLHLQLFDQIDNLLTAAAPPFHVNAFEVKVDGGWVGFSNQVLPKGRTVRFGESEGQLSS